MILYIGLYMYIYINEVILSVEYLLLWLSSHYIIEVHILGATCPGARIKQRCIFNPRAVKCAAWQLYFTSCSEQTQWLGQRWLKVWHHYHSEVVNICEVQCT